MIVGLGYVKRSGKDTAARALVDRLGFRRDGLADDLRAFVRAIDPIVRTPQVARLSDLIAEGWTEERIKDEHPEYRRILERTGTEGGRMLFGPDVWLRRVLDRVQPGENVVIPDVRFRNEAEAIQAAGGVVIRIDRPGYEPDPGHVSRIDLADWDGWDAVIANDSTPEVLARRICSLVLHPSLNRESTSGPLAEAGKELTPA